MRSLRLSHVKEILARLWAAFISTLNIDTHLLQSMFSAQVVPHNMFIVVIEVTKVALPEFSANAHALRRN